METLSILNGEAKQMIMMKSFLSVWMRKIIRKLSMLCSYSWLLDTFSSWFISLYSWWLYSWYFNVEGVEIPESIIQIWFSTKFQESNLLRVYLELLGKKMNVSYVWHRTQHQTQSQSLSAMIGTFSTQDALSNGSVRALTTVQCAENQSQKLIIFNEYFDG